DVALVPFEERLDVVPVDRSPAIETEVEAHRPGGAKVAELNLAELWRPAGAKTPQTLLRLPCHASGEAARGERRRRDGGARDGTGGAGPPFLVQRHQAVLHIVVAPDTASRLPCTPRVGALEGQ